MYAGNDWGRESANTQQGEREDERERMCMYFSVWMETEINVPSLDSPELGLYWKYASISVLAKGWTQLIYI